MDFFHNTNHTTTNCNNFSSDHGTSGSNNSTTFNMEQEYQEVNRMEMYYKWKVETCERRKSDMKWNQKCERMKPLVFAIDKKAKTKEQKRKKRKKKTRNKRKTKFEVIYFTITIICKKTRTSQNG